MSNANVRPYLLLMIFAIAACKPLQAADDQVRVVPASELGQWWQVVPGHDPQPPHLDMAQPLETGCIAVAFEIQGDGSVSNERVWRTTLTDSLAGKRLERGALQAMHQSRFVPALANKNDSPVYTYYVFTFTLIPEGSDRRRVEREENENKAECEMTDFPQQVQAMINAGANAKGGSQ